MAQTVPKTIDWLIAPAGNEEQREKVRAKIMAALDAMDPELAAHMRGELELEPKPDQLKRPDGKLDRHEIHRRSKLSIRGWDQIMASIRK